MRDTTVPPQEFVGGESSARPVGHDDMRAHLAGRSAWSAGASDLAALVVLALLAIGVIVLFAQGEGAVMVAEIVAPALAILAAWAYRRGEGRWFKQRPGVHRPRRYGPGASM